MDVAGEDARIPRSTWLTLVILLILQTCSFLDRQVLFLLVDPIRADLGISDFQVGLLQGVAFGLFYAFFTLPMGWIVDHYPRRRVIYWGVTIWALCAAGCGLARNFWQFLAVRIGVGVGEATLSPSSFALLSELFPRHRLSFAIGTFAAGASVGSALALALGALALGLSEEIGVVDLPLIGVIKPWQLVFIMTGLPGVFLAFLIFLAPEPVRKKPEPGTIDMAGLWRHINEHRSYLACHFFGFGCMSVCGYAVAAWLPAYVHRHYGLPLTEVGLLVSLTAVAGGATGYVMAGVIADRLFARGLKAAHLSWFAFVASPLLIVLALVSFGFVESLVLLLILQGLMQFFVPFVGPAAAHLQMTTPQAYRGRMSAIFLLVYSAMGLGLGPAVPAVFTDFVFGDPAKVGYSIAATVAIFGSLATLLLGIGTGPARRAMEGAERRSVMA